MILLKCVRIPLISSTVVSLKLAVIPVSPKISWPSLGSEIPSANFYFFDVLVDGRWVVRKFFRVFGTFPPARVVMFSKASSAVVNGW